MIAYASRTGTRRNLDALRSAGWRLLISATGVHRDEGFRFAIDNGAWTAFQQGRPFDGEAFMRLIASHGDRADWVAVPDIVEGGMQSLQFSLEWLPRLSGLRLLLLPVQDGMNVEDVRPLLSSRVGLFVGGSTAWKLSTMGEWGSLARSAGAYIHVGRVNTRRRILLCSSFGIDSFDGTSASRFAVNVPRLDASRKQLALKVYA